MNNGLHLVVTATGTKNWRQRLWFHGRVHNIGLGSAEWISLAEARAKALENRKIARAGGDPLFERSRGKEPTFAKVAEAVVEAALQTVKNPDKAKSEFDRHFGHYCKPIANQPIGSVKAAHILEVIEPIWNAKRRTAERLKTNISRVFDRAITLEWRETNPVDKLASVLPKGKPNGESKVTHLAALQHGEVAGAIAKVQASNASKAAKLAFEFCVLTASRNSEARLAQWGEIDLVNKVWTVPATRMKGGREHTVPLSNRAIAILGEARKLHDGDLVFVTAKGKPLNEKLISTTLFRQAGIENATLHGFRSTCRDYGNEQGVPHDVLERTLAHKVRNATEAAYNRTDLLEQRRQQLQAWADYLNQ